MHPVRNIKVISLICYIKANCLIPRTPMATRPLKDFQVASLCSSLDCPQVPWAPMFSRPLQNLQLPLLSSVTAYACVPRTTIFASPFEDFEVSLLGSSCA